ncbi:hypothetical protein QBC47DRAFT_417141 [Echria macrotheca]|uniref:Uncharacterized protein n=1 Tax=Echria macrotheca TaxID=438768 RepID=A0AAJ0F896_9PEZI|nr:hypothetical protein QBC47DRAFT_417141 [Echria macrotheca]
MADRGWIPRNAKRYRRQDGQEDGFVASLLLFCLFSFPLSPPMFHADVGRGGRAYLPTYLLVRA